MKKFNYINKESYIVLIIILLFLFLFGIMQHTGNDAFIQNLEKISFENKKVQGIVYYPSNHNTPFYKIGNFCFSKDNNLLNYLAIGDIVNKEYGSTILSITKHENNDSIILLDLKNSKGLLLEKCNCDTEKWICDSLK